MKGAPAKKLRTRVLRLIRSPWFELVASIAIIAIFILSLYAYTDNWPPMVVVESYSMQHGFDDTLGAINTGDIVLVQKVSVPSGVTTYIEGEQNGFSTYGEYGDVLLYMPNGNPTGTPIIHRAILYLEYTGPQGFEVPALSGLACSPGAQEQFQLFASPSSKVPYCLTNPDEPLLGVLELYHMGWNDITVSIDLGTLAQYEPWTGFVTLGDNNNGEYDQTWQGGQCAISCIVQPGWVEGVARGMIPWFGALKLWVDNDPTVTEVPPQSWDYLVLTILAIVVLPQAVPWAYRHLRGPRHARGGDEEDGGDEDAWEEVTQLSFERDREEYILVGIDRLVPKTPRSGAPGVTAYVLSTEEVEVPIASVRDRREGNQAVPIAVRLSDASTMTFEPPAYVEVEEDPKGNVLVIDANGPSPRRTEKAPRADGDWVGKE